MDPLERLRQLRAAQTGTAPPPPEGGGMSAMERLQALRAAQAAPALTEDQQQAMARIQLARTGEQSVQLGTQAQQPPQYQQQPPPTVQPIPTATNDKLERLRQLRAARGSTGAPSGGAPAVSLEQMRARAAALNNSTPGSAGTASTNNVPTQTRPRPQPPRPQPSQTGASRQALSVEEQLAKFSQLNNPTSQQQQQFPRNGGSNPNISHNNNIPQNQQQRDGNPNYRGRGGPSRPYLGRNPRDPSNTAHAADGSAPMQANTNNAKSNARVSVRFENLPIWLNKALFRKEVIEAAGGESKVINVINDQKEHTALCIVRGYEAANKLVTKYNKSMEYFTADQQLQVSIFETQRRVGGKFVDVDDIGKAKVFVADAGIPEFEPFKQYVMGTCIETFNGQDIKPLFEFEMMRPPVPSYADIWAPTSDPHKITTKGPQRPTAKAFLETHAMGDDSGNLPSTTDTNDENSHHNTQNTLENSEDSPYLYSNTHHDQEVPQYDDSAPMYL